MCSHQPPCPAADSAGRRAARMISSQSTQGWSLLCNGLIVFEDGGEILPDGVAVAAHRGPARHALATAGR